VEVEEVEEGLEVVARVVGVEVGRGWGPWMIFGGLSAKVVGEMVR